MHIESKQQDIARPASAVFDFIRDFRNFEYLMPEQVTNYQADYDHCSFETNALGKISLKMAERLKDKMVRAISGEVTPVKFELIVNISAFSPDSSSVTLALDAELSSMMAMLAKSPLTNFVNMLAEKLKSVMESK
jgi:carbon monoxide dehydrogenase subunit G